MLEVLQLLFSAAAVAAVVFLGVNTVRDTLSRRRGRAPSDAPRRRPAASARAAPESYGAAGYGGGFDPGGGDFGGGSGGDFGGGGDLGGGGWS